MNGLDVRLPREGRDVPEPPEEPRGGSATRWLTLAVPGAVVVVLALLLAVAGALAEPDGTPEPPAVPPGAAPPDAIDSYRGLGTWVDVFDYAPEYQDAGAAPAVDPADVAVMAANGVETLFLQAARSDRPADDGVVAPEAIAELLAEADAAGIRVVGWYAPGFTRPRADLQRLADVVAFSAGGRGFDSVVLDVSQTDPEPDAAARTAALVEISRGLREIVGDAPLGVAVLPPVQLEELNPDLWPAFPWTEVGELYDAVLALTYWTFREDRSSLRDPATYVTTNVSDLRERIGPDAAIHVVGGVADAATEQDYRDFAAGVTASAPHGASVFDYRSTVTGGWGALRGLLAGGGAWSTTSLQE